MTGLVIALLIISAWAVHLFYSLEFVQPEFSNAFFYLHVLIQGYLYTGLFITAHDAMHGVVYPGRRKLNDFIGAAASLLFAGMSYERLRKNHFAHHKYPGSEKDPDFFVKSQNFFLWFFTFMYRYTTILQLVIMAAVFNLLKLRYEETAVWFYWVIPAFLGALQLFFFGTYLPHREPHTDDMNPHKARTLPKNHLLAMLSCYFFGYHYEHHDAPHTPWWQLYKSKQIS